uniref:Uncharacterized protein n=1 Tax=Anguilla anguilla TaxID=7936 RepID=A0A0E9X3H2_ANGAN
MHTLSVPSLPKYILGSFGCTDTATYLFFFQKYEYMHTYISSLLLTAVQPKEGFKQNDIFFVSKMCAPLLLREHRKNGSIAGHLLFFSFPALVALLSSLSLVFIHTSSRKGQVHAESDHFSDHAHIAEG